MKKRHGPVVLVMAAGSGLGFKGQGHKLEQLLGSDTVLACTLKAAMASRLAVVVVSSAELAPAVRRLVASRDMVVLPQLDGLGRALPIGMGHSIAAGVAATGNAEGWLVLPADLPLLRPSSVTAVAQALEQHPVAFAQYRGRRGHPTGFSAELYSELVALDGDEGARRILARYPAYGVELDDEGVLLDIDSLADLERLRARLAVTPAGGRRATSPWLAPSRSRPR